QSFLLARAGLLPSQRGTETRPDQYIDKIESIRQVRGWEALSPAVKWERYKVRPLNHPVRRLMALSHWLRQGLFERWESFLLPPVLSNPALDSRRGLQNSLKVEDPAFWSGFYDFGRPLASPDAALLGLGRINEILINVILPFLLGWAEVHGLPHLSQKIVSLFYEFPGLEANSILRHMTAQLRLSQRQINSACRQQGLVHIYKSFCTEGLCHNCPLGR
ncbi:MAG TPA: DUF2851 family protein, partial [Dehalococcoidales bacterium]|nr:DUF2851 family protein [Dehalococcoidales bacterium]